MSTVATAMERAGVRPAGPKCPYCGGAAQLVDSAIVYHGRSYGLIWDCRPCDAYVGVHKNGTGDVPLGRLADAELRRWKVLAHAAFDPLWKTGGMARGAAYALLARLVGVPADQAHIGMFDVAQCRLLVAKLREEPDGA